MHPTPHRTQLAQQLRTVRQASGLSGNAFARKLGWQQSRVSKIETGVQMPTRDDVAIWAAAAEADTDTTVGLDSLARMTHVEYEDWRETYRREGAAGEQANIGQREARARTMCAFWPAMLPGLMQTGAYARDALAIPGGPKAWGATDSDIESMVSARIERQQVLYEAGKTLRVVLGEAALHTRFGEAGPQRGQLDRLVGLTGLASVKLRVLPQDTAWPVFPLSTFTIYDADLVMLEQPVGEHLITDPDQIRTYQEFFNLLDDAALGREETVGLIQTVATGLS
jgi:transcriptional regulator with XRE-family HTH domain